MTDPMSLTHAIVYVVLGFAVGAFGTLIGAGGGWLLVPILVFLHPYEPAISLTAISLAVVCVNAASGSFAYARMGRVDFRAALAFSAAGLPGSVLGAWATRFVDRRIFDPLLGGVLVLGSLAMLVSHAGDASVAAERASTTLIEKDGTVHHYRPRLRLGMLLSVGIGFVSSLLGIGGGILHVPAMVYVLGFPTHIATATSHATLAVLSLSAVLVHAADGTLRPVLVRVIPILVGVLPGAQLGARLSSAIKDRWILRALAIALLVVGIRLLWAR